MQHEIYALYCFLEEREKKKKKSSEKVICKCMMHALKLLRKQKYLYNYDHRMLLQWLLLCCDTIKMAISMTEFSRWRRNGALGEQIEIFLQRQQQQQRKRQSQSNDYGRI
uniref:Uncharacterized protein n=1 Tax=Onchocerca volvulus TaxID=6282 RepID=A0A8R1TNP4_ONCVO